MIRLAVVLVALSAASPALAAESVRPEVLAPTPMPETTPSQFVGATIFFLGCAGFLAGGAIAATDHPKNEALGMQVAFGSFLVSGIGWLIHGGD